VGSGGSPPVVVATRPELAAASSSILDSGVSEARCAAVGVLSAPERVTHAGEEKTWSAFPADCG